MRRVPSLADFDTGVDREVGSNFDTIKIVADNIDKVITVGEGLEYSYMYLGGSTTPPTVRLDGSPLQDGDYYTNTLEDTLNYYDLAEDKYIELDPEALLEAAGNAETASVTAVEAAIQAGLSETAAANSATSAFASKESAATSEVNAGSSETNASASAVAASASETNASNSESNAATSEANAATSESNSATNAQATAADVVATNADVVTTNADAVTTTSDRIVVEALYDTFDDRYLGTKATDPTVDNDGDPLQIGAVYFNSVDDSTKFYNGATWEDPKSTATQAALTATTKANEAATSAGNAAVSETNAGNSEANAATSESNAGTSETNAAASALAAANSESSAANSESNALNAVDAAEAYANAASVSEANAAASANNLSYLGVVPKQEFNILAAKRKSDDIASGFSEWGKVSENVLHEFINQGMWTGNGHHASSKYLRLGAKVSSNTNVIGVPTGKSRSLPAIVNINGVLHTIDSGDDASNTGFLVSFPPAPDGTKTYDFATGDVVQHADSAAAFASETATNKVIIARKDYVIIESVHNKVSDEGFIYPLGCFHCDGAEYKGITLLTRDDDFTRLGEWDSLHGSEPALRHGQGH